MDYWFDHFLICLYFLIYVALLVVSWALVITDFYVGFKAIIILNNLTRLRRIIVPALNDFLFKREVVVEPAVVNGASAEAVLRLIEVLLLDVDLGNFEKGNNGDVAKFVHVYEPRQQIFDYWLGLVFEWSSFLGAGDGTLVLDHLLEVEDGLL